MIEALHEIRNLAVELQADLYYPQQKQIASIIELCDATIEHFTDDGR